MITPENKLPLDDSSNAEAEDQQSQKDLHSNGFEEHNETLDQDEQTDAASLKQAYDAATPSYTLDTDKGIADQKED